MREVFKKHHILMRLLALLIAIALWVIVIESDNPVKDVDLPNLQVEFLGKNTLLSEHNLVVSKIGNETVSVKVEGKFKTLENAKADNVTVRADVSSYTEPGTYNLSYEVSLPNGIMVKSRSPEVIPIVIEEIVEKELPVRVERKGTLAEGVHVDEATVEPSVVMVSGTASVMEKAEYAVVKLDAALLTKDYSDACGYVITDAEGNELESEFTRRIDRTVQVDIPVFLSKSVPVEVGVIASAGVPRTNIVTTYEPPAVMVYGRAADIAPLKSIKLGDVNVRDFVLTYDKEFPVILPEGVSFYDEAVESVNVHVSFKDVVTTQLEVTNISLINVPENAQIDLEMTNLEITVRGETDKMKNVDAGKFLVSVDLADVDLQPGRQFVPAAVKVSVGGYDVCGSYNVIINVMETEEEG